MKDIVRDPNRTKSLLDEHINLDYLNKQKVVSKLKKKKKKTSLLKDEKNEIVRKMNNLKNSPAVNQDIAKSEIQQLSKDKKSLEKKIKKRKKKAKQLKKEISQFDDRYDISDVVAEIVNVEGLFRTPDNRFLENHLLDNGLYLIGKMLNHAVPNYRKITAMIETIIGNISMCTYDPMVHNSYLIQTLTDHILKHKPILDSINPMAIILYNKFLMLSGLDGVNIVYECDRIVKTNKFSKEHRKYCEGRYAFDQFVDFAKYQRKYMNPSQQLLFSQYQKIIRVMEDMGLIDCQSGKIKQRIRNGLRDVGLKRNQIGQLIHYTYDKSLDAARDYYAKKGSSAAKVVDFAHDISRFSPDYAGELYAMSGF